MIGPLDGKDGEPVSTPGADFTHIAYEVDASGIATITLDRPDRLNAFTLRMQNELLEAFDQIDSDDEVRAVVVTGRGRGFCAGVDLGAPGETFQPDAQGRGGVVTLRIYRCLKPVIGAVNGPAVGVGASMLLPMDLRIAAADARIGFVFTRRGLIPDGVSGWFLPRLVGMATAVDWCYSGRIFGALEAESRGLVQRVVDGDALLAQACEMARELTEHSSPVAVATTKRLLWHMQSEADPARAYEAESRASNWLGRRPDAAEGIAAFLEKRPPRFPARVSRDLPPWSPFADHD